MTGNPEVIELLNEVLTTELTSINQYFLDAMILDNWGYERLAAHFRGESIDEMKDAEKLVERVLYLDGHPNVQRLGSIRTGASVVEKLQLALDLEQESINRLNTGLTLCIEHEDGGTRELLEEILAGEESHADWLESQLELVRQVGDMHYMSQQIRE